MRTPPGTGRTPHRTKHRKTIAPLLTLAMVAAGAAITSPAAADPPANLNKIDRQVLQQAAKAKHTTFWIVLHDQANLRRAPHIHDRTTRGAYVVDQLKDTADRSQRDLRTLLTKLRAPHQPYWIANTIRATGDTALLRRISADPNVRRVVPDRTYRIPTPRATTATPTSGETSTDKPGTAATEWNIDRIRAPQVWSAVGVRGEGIVVANIDTGVQFDHPALVAQYRGNHGAGFDHNYNWYDPTNTCGGPSPAPCDNVGHGTHTMGTMVGDDGTPGPNQIGVAPGARWIAAKGCENSGCPTAALLAAGQWILAPTDLNGENPRPDLRPHIVNNSWGGSGGDPFYQTMVNAWIASGIFPTFSVGNAGPNCNTAESPGDYPQSYSVGAFDIDNVIASFSSRGPSGNEIKPNITAPGVNIRSSVPSNSYATYNGTSMAAPHVAATVALMWSAATNLVGDITSTRALLDRTAIDVPDLSCGGTPGDNNVWGEGRLDAYAAVNAAPRSGGTLRGTVTNTSTGAPVRNAEIRVAGPVDRTTATNTNGQYRLVLAPGTYTLTVTAFGFGSRTIRDVRIRANATTIQNLPLQPAPTRVLTGHVRDIDGAPIPNATVTLPGTPIPPARTDATGAFRFPRVPEGEYTIRATADACREPQQRRLVVDGPETVTFTLPPRADSYGYTCRIATPNYIEADTVLPLSGDDQTTQVTLPFPVTFYGQTYRTAHISTNGVMNFLAPSTDFANTAIPDPQTPNAALYPFWDDLYVDSAASVRTETSGSAPNRVFVVEWRNIALLRDTNRRLDVEIVLHQNGQIRFEYRNIDNESQERGDSATIGIENQNGTVAFQYSFDTASISSPTFALLFSIPPGGVVQGTVTDYNDRLPIAGATVRALRGDTVARVTTTAADGRYRLALPLGRYTIQVTATNYATATATVVIDTLGETITRDFTLRTARAVVTPTSLEYVVPVGLSRQKAVTLRNTGSLPMTWQASAPVPWLNGLPPTAGTLAPAGSQQIRFVVNAAGFAAGTYHTTIVLRTSSGRQAELRIPVRLVVSGYFVGINSGGNGYTDSAGDYWWADRPYQRGSWGYTNPGSTTARTSRPIAGTTDDLLYQELRSNPLEYRFDGLPVGVYEIDLRFAEITSQAPNTRLADVIAENVTLLPAHDIANEVGSFAADRHVFYVRVTDGQLNLRFVERYRFALPIVNAIRVIHRPDR